MSYIRCTVCNGAKVSIGLGMIEENCRACDGLGWIEKTKEAPVKAEKTIEDQKPTIAPKIHWATRKKQERESREVTGEL